MATYDAEHRQFVGAGRRPQYLEIRSPAGPLNGFEPHPGHGSAIAVQCSIAVACGIRITDSGSAWMICATTSGDAPV